MKENNFKNSQYRNNKIRTSNNNKNNKTEYLRYNGINIFLFIDSFLNF